MAMHFGRGSNGSPKSVKWVFVALGILIGSLLLVGALVYLFFLVVHPLLIGFVIPIPASDVHMGVSYFEDGSYLSYEHGGRFEEALDDSGYLSCGDVVDFYHVDYRLRDNPIYGKMLDIFAVDIQMSPERYAECSDAIIEGYEYCCNMDDYVLYVRSEQSENGYIDLVALCDKASVLRCILLADMEPPEHNSFYGDALFMNTGGLAWEVP